MSLMGHICFLLKREQRGGKSSCWGVSFPRETQARQIQMPFSLLLLPVHTAFTLTPLPPQGWPVAMDNGNTPALQQCPKEGGSLCPNTQPGQQQDRDDGTQACGGPNSAKLLYIQVTWEDFHWDEMFSRYLVWHALIKKIGQCSIL